MMSATLTTASAGDTDVTLLEVARIYNTTAAMGWPAIDEVTTRLGCSPRTAQRKVHQAHQQGLIPTLQRKPHRKILQIAEALDVTPIELADAVQRIAGGTLTITNHSLTDQRITP